MACPTCDHTMDSIVIGVYWCSRCGTLKLDSFESTAVPKLVERVRELREISPRGTVSAMKNYGIDEAILTPDKR